MRLSDQELRVSRFLLTRNGSQVGLLPPGRGPSSNGYCRRIRPGRRKPGVWLRKPFHITQTPACGPPPGIRRQYGLAIATEQKTTNLVPSPRISAVRLLKTRL